MSLLIYPAGAKQRQIVRALPEVGFVATNLADGFRRAGTFKPGVVLIDAGYSDQTGIDVIAWLRRTLETSALVVLIDGMSDDVIERARRAGAFGYCDLADLSQLRAVFNAASVAARALDEQQRRRERIGEILAEYRAKVRLRGTAH